MSEHTHHRPRGWRHWLAFLVALTLLVAACADSDSDDAATDSGGDDSGDADTLGRGSTGDDGGDDSFDGDGDDGGFDEGDDMADDDGGDTSAESLFDRAGTDENQTGAPPDIPDFATALFVGRDIIFTGDIVLEAPDVEATTRSVIRSVVENGGAIWGQDSTSDPTPRTVLTIRVPPTEFPTLMALLTELQGVGVISESVTTDDVTEVVVDLDARISAAEAGVERIQTRLDAANDLNLIFTLEEELANRQAALERLLGKRKTLQDQITLSTITVTIVEADPDRLTSEFEVVTWLGADSDDACPGVSDLSIEADGSAVLCVNISNTGEDALTDIDIAAPTFRLRVDDFTIVPGNASRDSIAAGDELLAWVRLDAEGGFIQRVDASDGIRIEVEVTATPATTSAVDLTMTDSVFISADVDDPLPGFGDSFADGWGAMTYVVSLLMIAVGVLLPFLVFLIPLWWVGRKLTERSRIRADG